MHAAKRPVIRASCSEGDKLAENWVYIDLLHFWKTQGVDILERTTEICT